MSDAHAAAPGGEEAAPKKPISLPMIFALLNVVAMLAAMGTLVYTRVLFKRPAITETGERERLAALHAHPAAPTETAYVNFEPMTANIASSGKLRYATIGFTLEIRDAAGKPIVNSVQSLIQDKFLSILGRKQFHELTNVQGRYVLKTQLLDATNQIIRENAGRIKPDAEPKKGGEGGGEHGGGHGAKAEGGADHHEVDLSEDLVTNVLFTQFVVQ